MRCFDFRGQMEHAMPMISVHFQSSQSNWNSQYQMFLTMGNNRLLARVHKPQECATATLKQCRGLQRQSFRSRGQRMGRNACCERFVCMASYKFCHLLRSTVLCTTFAKIIAGKQEEHINLWSMCAFPLAKCVLSCE